MSEEKLVHKAVHHLYDHPTQGDLLMDAPSTSSWRELLMWAADRDKWRARAKSLGLNTVTIRYNIREPASEFAFTTSS